MKITQSFTKSIHNPIYNEIISKRPACVYISSFYSHFFNTARQYGNIAVGMEGQGDGRCINPSCILFSIIGFSTSIGYTVSFLKQFEISLLQIYILNDSGIENVFYHTHRPNTESVWSTNDGMTSW